MMENHEFCDNCHGCRPALADPKTMQPLPLDHPIMVKVDELWDNETTYDQRKAFIEVTLHNSRTENDMRLAEEVISKIKNVLDEN